VPANGKRYRPSGPALLSRKRAKGRAELCPSKNFDSVAKTNEPLRPECTYVPELRLARRMSATDRSGPKCLVSANGSNPMSAVPGKPTLKAREASDTLASAAPALLYCITKTYVRN